MACAMPQAMERSDATPTISARLPLMNPMYPPMSWIRPAFCQPDLLKGKSAAANVDRELLPDAQRRVLADAVPVHQVRHRDAEHLCDARERVAAAHLVAHRARTARSNRLAARAGAR